MTPFPVLASVHALLVASTLALTSLAASAETTPRQDSSRKAPAAGASVTATRKADNNSALGAA